MTSERTGFAEMDSLVYTQKEDGPLNGTYYIRVKAFTAANYQIDVRVFRKNPNDENAISTAQERRLHHGVADYGYLNYNHEEAFYFYTPRINGTVDVDHKTNIFLYFKTIDRLTKKRVHSDAAPTIKIFHHPQNESFQDAPLIITQNYTSSDFFYIQVYTNHSELGRYVIQLDHTDAKYQNISFKYTVMVNREDVIFLLPDGGYIGEIQTNYSEIYEMYLSEPAKVYLEVFECFGKVNLHAAGSLSALTDQNQTIKPTVPTKRYSEHTIYNFNAG